jgi:SAM-dependent methyltransferase
MRISLNSKSIDEFLRIQPNGENEAHRFLFVSNWISELRKKSTVLDIGAGTRPFLEVCRKNELKYLSHDFNQYVPSSLNIGLQSFGYMASDHDFIFDISDLPTNITDNAFCTEVLEHVPDPVIALKSCMGAVKNGGSLLITVPLFSFIHQAPYYFSAGLSPWWFKYHAGQFGAKSIKIIIVGDYVDFLIQEIPRIFEVIRHQKSRYLITKSVRKLIKLFAPILRRWLPDDLLYSTGLSVYVIIRK